MKNLFTIILIALITTATFANPNNSTSFMNEAGYIAEVKSFTTSGFLKVDFQCYIDANYTSLEKKPTLYLQIGTTNNPTEYQNIKLDEATIKFFTTDAVYNDDNFKVKLNIGKISVKKGFKARILVKSGNDLNFVDINPVNYDNSITYMESNKESNNRDMCEADLFLRKIDFANLQNEYSFVGE